MANVVSFHESIALPGDSGGVVAILTEPGSEITGQQRPSVTLLNAGVIHRVGPHRLHVRLARALAAAGFPALRLDLSGIGDSRPLAEGLTFRESAVADIRTALDWQVATGLGCRAWCFVALWTSLPLAILAAALTLRAWLDVLRARRVGRMPSLSLPVTALRALPLPW